MADSKPEDDILFLNGTDIEKLLTFEDSVQAVRQAYQERGNGADTAPRISLTNTENGGKLKNYVAVLPQMGVMGGYVYAAGFANRSSTFMLPLFDSKTGAPLALLDGRTMNPYKTGSVGAVAVEALAKPDAETVALFGSGRQAKAQIQAICEVRDLTDIRVYSPTTENRELFAREMNDILAPKVSTVDTNIDAVGKADIVITATRASEPVFDGDELSVGTHVNAIGQYNPYKRELDETTISRSKYVPDLRDRVYQDAGAFLYAREQGVITNAHIYAELGEIVAGAVPGRTGDEITVFDSGGTALETVGLAGHIYEQAIKNGVGTSLSF